MSDKCACERQIVWYFKKPTVVVCVRCQITLYYDEGVCPYCKGPITYFKADRVEYEEEVE